MYFYIYNVNHLLLDKFVKFYNSGEVYRVLGFDLFLQHQPTPKWLIFPIISIYYSNAVSETCQASGFSSLWSTYVSQIVRNILECWQH